MNEMDPVSLGIMWDRLTAITDEILLSIVRTSFSVGVREAWDLACVLFDREGRSMAQATLSMPASPAVGPPPTGGGGIRLDAVAGIEVLKGTGRAYFP